MENLFWVSSKSPVAAVAGAIAKSIREGNSVALQSIGAGALNQAVKAIAAARSYLAADGLDVVCAPSFVLVMIDDAERSALRFHIDLPGRPLPAVPAIVRSHPAP